MEYFLEGIAPLTQMKRVTNTNILFWTKKQSLNGALPSRKCSVKAPANFKTSVYVLMEICLQWSKWLVPILYIVSMLMHYAAQKVLMLLCLLSKYERCHNTKVKKWRGLIKLVGKLVIFIVENQFWLLDQRVSWEKYWYINCYRTVKKYIGMYINENAK